MKEAPKFGPGIIGQEEYDRQLAEIEGNPGKYGPAVMNRVHGPAITGEAAPEPPVKAPTAGPPESTQLSVTKIKKVLAEDPGMATQVLDAELERAEGPRKSAIREVAKIGRLSDDAALVDRAEVILEGLE